MLVFPTRCGSGFFMNTRGRNPLFHHLSSTCRSSSELDDGLTGADDGSAARAIHVEGTCSGSLSTEARPDEVDRCDRVDSVLT